MAVAAERGAQVTQSTWLVTRGKMTELEGAHAPCFFRCPSCRVGRPDSVTIQSEQYWDGYTCTTVTKTSSGQQDCCRFKDTDTDTDTYVHYLKGYFTCAWAPRRRLCHRQRRDSARQIAGLDRDGEAPFCSDYSQPKRMRAICNGSMVPEGYFDVCCCL